MRKPAGEVSAGEELLGFFRAMADPSRLKIVGLLAQQPCAVEQLSALLGIGESTVSHHLARLAEAGLVSARAEGHYSMYSLHQDALAAMAQQAAEDGPASPARRGIDHASFDRKVLASFTGPDGRFTAFPTQEKKFLVLLRHVLQGFPPGRPLQRKKGERDPLHGTAKTRRDCAAASWSSGSWTGRAADATTG